MALSDDRQLRESDPSRNTVTQDVTLLHRSVGDYIRYGRPEATQEEVERVTKMASADGAGFRSDRAHPLRRSCEPRGRANI
jgi:hypothetical protein